MSDAPTHKGNYAGELWPPGYHEATHYWLDGEWRSLPLSMEQNMRLMASEIEWLRKRVKDLTLEGLALIGRIEQTREALAGTDIGSLPNDYPIEKMALDAAARIEQLEAEKSKLRRTLAEIAEGELTDHPMETRAFARAALEGKPDGE